MVLTHRMTGSPADQLVSFGGAVHGAEGDYLAHLEEEEVYSRYMEGDLEDPGD
ncbi:MAG: hypothetical protein R3F14_29185 [Polyangiaceae bacterium]